MRDQLSHGLHLGGFLISQLGAGENLTFCMNRVTIIQAWYVGTPRRLVVRIHSTSTVYSGIVRLTVKYRNLQRASIVCIDILLLLQKDRHGCDLFLHMNRIILAYQVSFGYPWCLSNFSPSPTMLYTCKRRAFAYVNWNSIVSYWVHAWSFCNIGWSQSQQIWVRL
jgi:hypothetical protein